MNDSSKKGKGPIEDRLILLRRFPKEVVESLTKEELNIFTHEDELPIFLYEKLREYLVD